MIIIMIIMIMMMIIMILLLSSLDARAPAAWLRANGGNTNGAAAKVTTFDRLGKKVRPGTLGNIKLG